MMESLITDSILYPLLLAFLFIPIITIKLNNIQKRSKQPPLPPGPSPWPIVGNLLELRKNRPAYKWIDGIMKQLSTDIACIRLGNVHVVVISSAELARKFLHENDAIFASRPLTMTSEHATYGYLTMGLTPMGQQWKKMRKMYCRELVSPARLRWLLVKRNEEADNLVNFIYNQCCKDSNQGAVVDVRLALRHYFVNIFRKMTFNKRYFGEIQKDGGPGEAEKEHVEALFALEEYINAFCTSDFLPWLRMLDVDGYEKIVKNAMRVLNRYHDPIIDERMKQWKDGKREEPEDLLDVMILLKDESGMPLLTVDEIRAQCSELFFPADSPANAVEWIIAEMINQPDILHQATKEIDRVVGKDKLVQESDIPQLNYLKACVREAFRLHPVSPFNLPHVAISDAIVAGYFIPRGSNILLHRPGLGRNPKVWKEPTKFKPERHLSDMSSKIEVSEPSLKFVSFSTGKRGCPAISLGTEITVMALGRLLQGFTWSAPPNEKSIDLSESSHQLSLARALHAHAKPRLPKTTYLVATVAAI